MTNDFLEIKELYHHGIKGQKWGVRKYQNEDGSLTAEGEKRYNTGHDTKNYNRLVRDTQREYGQNAKAYKKEVKDIKSQYKNKKISKEEYLNKKSEARVKQQVENQKTYDAASKLAVKYTDTGKVARMGSLKILGGLTVTAATAVAAYKLKESGHEAVDATVTILGASIAASLLKSGSGNRTTAKQIEASRDYDTYTKNNR